MAELTRGNCRADKPISKGGRRKDKSAPSCSFFLSLPFDGIGEVIAAVGGGLDSESSKGVSSLLRSKQHRLA
jgi:hypothetical protein